MKVFKCIFDFSHVIGHIKTAPQVAFVNQFKCFLLFGNMLGCFYCTVP